VSQEEGRVGRVLSVTHFAETLDTVEVVMFKLLAWLQYKRRIYRRRLMVESIKSGGGFSCIIAGIVALMSCYPVSIVLGLPAIVVLAVGAVLCVATLLLIPLAVLFY